MNLNEQDLSKRAKEFKTLVIVFGLFTIFLLVYTGHLFFNGHYQGAIVSIGVTFISLAQLFRNHFWLYQLKQRRLGCSVSEWFRCGVRGKKP